MLRTRFAPSPTGPLHLGHAYSALLSHDMAKSGGGSFVLRIEDTDRLRCKSLWTEQIFDDLKWLGLEWEAPVIHQSERFGKYQKALCHLMDQELLFPCSCSRKDIEAAVSAPQEGVPSFGPDGRIYPGTCRKRSMDSIKDGEALRLNIKAAIARVKNPLTYTEIKNGTITKKYFQLKSLITTVGDIVLQRRQSRDIAYHLSVVLDDSTQSITDVVRGEDLEDSTQIHVLLQKLLGLKTPNYHHHQLIRDEAGKRLAKRTDAKSIQLFRRNGASPDDIRRMVGL